MVRDQRWVKAVLVCGGKKTTRVTRANGPVNERLKKEIKQKKSSPRKKPLRKRRGGNPLTLGMGEEVEGGKDSASAKTGKVNVRDTHGTNKGVLKKDPERRKGGKDGKTSIRHS